VVIAVFLAGIAIGDFLFVHQNKPLQTNSHLDQFTSQIEMNPSGLGGGS
jgi:acetyltransferase-like isoleucine patch superfamily enzyme